MPKIGAHGRHNPDGAAFGQPGEQPDKYRAIFVRNILASEQFLELINQKNKLGILEREQLSGFAPSFGKPR